MGIARRVKIHDFALNRILSNFEGKIDRLLVRGQDADLQRGKRSARVAVADLGEKIKRFGRHANLFRSKPTLRIGQGPLDDQLNLLARERLKSEDLTAA